MASEEYQISECNDMFFKLPKPLLCMLKCKSAQLDHSFSTLDFQAKYCQSEQISIGSVKTEDSEECLICLSPLSTKFRVSQKCKHYFCQNCLLAYSIYKINLLEKVLCPFQQCRTQLEISSPIYRSLPYAMKQKYHKVLKTELLLLNPQYKACPGLNCQATIQITKLNRNRPRCERCKTYICLQCYRQRHRGKCSDNVIELFELGMNFQKCGKCLNFIEKKEGCDKMHCKCGNVFCYNCGVQWNDNHFCNKNPNFLYDYLCLWILFKILYLIGFVLLAYPLIIIRSLIVAAIYALLAIILGVTVEPCEILKSIGSQNCCLSLLLFLFYPILMVIGSYKAIKMIYLEAGDIFWTWEIACSPLLLGQSTLGEIKRRLSNN